MSELVKSCWHCGGCGFVRTYVHKETGYVIETCAMCHAPFNLHDEQGLRIMEIIDTPEAKSYVVAWRGFLKAKD